MFWIGFDGLIIIFLVKILVVFNLNNVFNIIIMGKIYFNCFVYECLKFIFLFFFFYK